MDDEAGFVSFYRVSYARIVAQVFPVVTSMAEAEDITQESFVRAAARWTTIRGYDAPEAWVRRVALNLASSTVRRTRRRAFLLFSAHREEHVEGPSIEQLALVQAMSQLPLRYRSVLALHYVVDLSVHEIAAELSMPEATVRTRLARGRRRLAELLDDAAPRDAEQVADV